jgi:hypothetical protein
MNFLVVAGAFCCTVSITEAHDAMSLLQVAHELTSQEQQHQTHAHTPRSHAGLYHQAEKRNGSQRLHYMFVDSTRIGNLILWWYFGNMPGWIYQNLYRDGFEQLGEEQCPGSEKMCFGKYIKEVAQVTPLSTQKVLELNRYTTQRFLHEHNIRIESFIFDPITLQLVSESFGADLAIATQGYTDTYSLQIHQNGSKHCVVHYRVGDKLKSAGYQNLIISPESFAAAVASFTPLPDTIEILNGGINHGNDRLENEEIRKSWDLLEEVRVTIEAEIPSARVIMSTSGSADEDWFKIATASMVAFTPSTFALTAALAGVNNKVRSPEPGLLKSVNYTEQPPRIIRPGWTTYSYDLREF